MLSPLFSTRNAAYAFACCALVGCRATKISTTHFLGVFDPQQQVTQELYKVKITGKASWYSDAKFATGWVPAGVADRLGETVDRKSTAGGSVYGDHSKTDPKNLVAVVKPKRQFYEVGPLGVSVAPENQRFVAMMGSNPNYFFQKLSMLTTLGEDPGRNSNKGKSAVALLAARERVAVSAAMIEVDKQIVEADKDTQAAKKLVEDIALKALEANEQAVQAKESASIAKNAATLATGKHDGLLAIQTKVNKALEHEPEAEEGEAEAEVETAKDLASKIDALVDASQVNKGKATAASSVATEEAAKARAAATGSKQAVQLAVAESKLEEAKAAAEKGAGKATEANDAMIQVACAVEEAKLIEKQIEDMPKQGDQ